MRRPLSKISASVLFAGVQVLSPFLYAANTKARNCAEALILAAAKKNVRDVYKNRPNGGGVCALGVRQSLQLSKVGGVEGPLGNAIDYIKTMPPQGFVDSGVRDPKKAPPGSILVFSGPKSAEYLRTGKLGSPAGDWVGHVTIKGDDGYYYTDGRTAEPAIGWTKDRNTGKTRNMAAIFVAGVELINEFNGKCAKLARDGYDEMTAQDLFLIAALATSVPSFASSKTVTTSCKGCESSNKLIQNVAPLSFMNKADRNKGYRAVEPALDELRKFLALEKNNETRQLRFEALINMVREVAPYDVEGQLTQSLAKELAKDSGLQSQYNSVLDQLRASETPVDRCKTTALHAAVTESLCLISAGVKGQDHHREQVHSTNNCIQAFNIEDCLTQIR